MMNQRVRGKMRWMELKFLMFKETGYRRAGLKWLGFKWQGLKWQGLKWLGFKWQGFKWLGFKWLGLVLLVAIGGLGCALTPQGMRERQERREQERREQGQLEALAAKSPSVAYLMERAARPLAVSEEMVVVDSRSAFDYSLARVKDSIHLRVSDLGGASLNRAKEADLRELVRRLALHGIEPSSEVLVVGPGLKGRGEEGQLALRLFFLGIERVQFVGIDFFGRRLTSELSSPRENVGVWMPELKLELMASERELEESQVNPSIHLVDIRSEADFLRSRDFEAINIPWKQFLTESGRPRFELRWQLEAIGIGISDRVIVLGDRDLEEDPRAASATMALLSLGYWRAGLASF